MSSGFLHSQSLRIFFEILWAKMCGNSLLRFSKLKQNFQGGPDQATSAFQGRGRSPGSRPPGPPDSPPTFPEGNPNGFHIVPPDFAKEILKDFKLRYFLWNSFRKNVWIFSLSKWTKIVDLQTKLILKNISRKLPPTFGWAVEPRLRAILISLHKIIGYYGKHLSIFLKTVCQKKRPFLFVME